MSRVRKAGVTAAFAYVQLGLSMAAGIALVPLTLAYVDARSWGLWLATGELLGYAAMVDLGVLSVLPWMIAEADGRQDRASLRRLLSTGLAAAAIAALGYAAAGLAVWAVLPRALDLSAADRLQLRMPLAILVGTTALTYPLRVCRALLAGLQDAAFNGALAIVQTLLAAGITVVLLLNGYGVMALALAAAVPTVVISVAALVRAALLTPELFRGWTRPAAGEVRGLLAGGLGAWFAGIGWQLSAASNAIVITALGRPELVAVYACTAKLSALGTQFAWVLPDSGLVGLAQLHGEGVSADRVRSVVLMMLRLHLVLSGLLGCFLLAFNPTFVRVWVGPEFFGGVTLNVLLAAGVVATSFVHGLLTTTSVIGNRLRVGVLTLLNGGAQTALALALGSVWGLTGIGVAAIVSAALIAVPGATILLGHVSTVRMRDFRTLSTAWFVRILPGAVGAAAVGAASGWLRPDGALALTLGVCGVALWAIRPLFLELPIDPRWNALLVRARVVPATLPHAAAPAGADQ